MTYKYFGTKEPHELKMCPTCGLKAWIKKRNTFCSRQCANPKGVAHFNYKGGSSLWREDPNEYRKVHYNVTHKRGYASKCSSGCVVIEYQWANLTRNYWDTTDYVSMCIPCHTRFDRYLVAVLRTE